MKKNKEELLEVFLHSTTEELVEVMREEIIRVDKILTEDIPKEDRLKARSYLSLLYGIYTDNEFDIDEFNINYI